MARTGRPRGFDEEQALERARDLFWSQGYAATSIQDLVDELEVQRGSLYGTFGDKRALYLDAVRLYWSDNERRLRAALAHDPVLPTLRRMLRVPTTVTGRAAGGRGCLMGNTVAELVPADDEARTVVAEAFATFVDVVAGALERGQENGEVVRAATPRAQAELLLMLFQGSALVARTSSRRRVQAGVDAALDALAVETHPRPAK